MIKKLLEKWSCSHDWKLYMRMNSWDSKIDDDKPYQVQDTLICQKCGKIKKITL